MRLRLSSAGRRGAFTLVELMVVLVIIGIAAAVIVAEMGGSLQDALLRASTRQIISACNAAYGRAVATGHACRVALNMETGSYVLERRRGRSFVALEENSDDRGNIDPRIRVQVRAKGESMAPPGTITFYADGTADDCQIKLTDRAGVARLVRVDPITARLQVSEAENEAP